MESLCFIHQVIVVILGSFKNSDNSSLHYFMGNTNKIMWRNTYYFILEWNELAVDGIFYQDIHYNLTIKYFLCDAPVKSFLKCIINHTGYSSCERRCIHGTYEGRIVFNEEIEYALREDAALRLTNCVDHQKKSIISISQDYRSKLDINICYRLHASCLFKGSSEYFKLSEKRTCW